VLSHVGQNKLNPEYESVLERKQAVGEYSNFTRCGWKGKNDVVFNISGNHEAMFTKK